MTQFLKTTQIAIGGAKTLPRRYYVAPELFGEELEKIFARRWLCVGREDQISQPGQFFLQQIGTESIIVLRDRRGSLRAYYNVCRHRGTRLCEEHRGQFSETIQCPFCGQAFEITIDTSVESQRFTTDCEICCRPFEVTAECEPGEILSLDVAGN